MHIAIFFSINVMKCFVDKTFYHGLPNDCNYRVYFLEKNTVQKVQGRCLH